MDVEALADSTRELLRELAAVCGESEALRRELESVWPCDDDERPTLVPIVDDDELDLRDTLRC